MFAQEPISYLVCCILSKALQVKNYLTLYSIGYFYNMTFSIFRQHWKKFKKKLSKVFNTFENIKEDGEFANAPISIIFSDVLYFKGVKKH